MIEGLSDADVIGDIDRSEGRSRDLVMQMLLVIPTDPRDDRGN